MAIKITNWPKNVATITGDVSVDTDALEALVRSGNVYTNSTDSKMTTLNTTQNNIFSVMSTIDADTSNLNSAVGPIPGAASIYGMQVAMKTVVVPLAARTDGQMGSLTGDQHGNLFTAGYNRTDGVMDTVERANSNQQTLSSSLWAAATTNQSVLTGAGAYARKTVFFKVATDAGGAVTWSVYGVQDSAATISSLLYTKSYGINQATTDTYSTELHYPYMLVTTHGTAATATTTSILEGRGQ